MTWQPMDTTSFETAVAEVVAVCTSPGGVPKLPLASAEVRTDGLVGDAHDHDKHRSPKRAVSIQDLEILEALNAEGFALEPGTIGENLTVRGLHVQALSVGDHLHFEEGPVLELSEPRKPCFVLDKIDPMLKEVIVGRCGFMARVVKEGELKPGQRVLVDRRPSPASQGG